MSLRVHGIHHLTAVTARVAENLGDPEGEMHVFVTDVVVSIPSPCVSATRRMMSGTRI